MKELPLVVITGPTASGKTGLAIELAKEFDGEIICADSRTIYKYMDIGTAKPTKDEQREVQHWGLDLVEPGERFTAYDFKLYADQKIAEIRSRGRIPFLVGGTGLYIDAVIFNFQFHGPEDLALRKTLEGMTLEELHIYCIKNNIKLPQNEKNRRYVIRAIERADAPQGEDRQLIDNCIVVGISTERNILKQRIHERASHIVTLEVVKEATILAHDFGWRNEAMTGNIYPLIHRYIEEGISLDEVRSEFATLDWRLAKRQLTWMRRNEYIKWFDLGVAKDYLRSRLAND